MLTLKVHTVNVANNDSVITKAQLIRSGNITEMVGMTNDSHSCNFQKLSKDEYMVLSTGEVKEYDHKISRLENINSVRKTIKTLRRLINANVLNAEYCKWITLTYAENMTDTKRLYSDFDSFRKRLIRYLTKNDIPIPEYISVVEPQARGAWHIHLILIWNQSAPFLDNNSVITRLWGHGFTKTKALNNVDNIGAYFSAYLADMPLDEISDMDSDIVSLINASCSVIEKSFTDDDDTIKDKKFVKGARLYLYPTGMNLYRTSRNIKRPQVIDISKSSYYDIVNTYDRNEKKASLGELTFSSATSVTDDGKVINDINRYYFNTKIN